MSDQSTTQTTRKHSLPLAAVLATADLLISLMLMTRRNERTVQPTKRVSIPDNIKKGLAQFQEYRCMFCGVRRKLPNLQIDHVNPVIRGGSNETSNFNCSARPATRERECKPTRSSTPGTRTPSGESSPAGRQENPFPRQIQVRDQVHPRRPRSPEVQEDQVHQPRDQDPLREPNRRRPLWGHLGDGVATQFRRANQPRRRHISLRGHCIGPAHLRGAHGESKGHRKVPSELSKLLTDNHTSSPTPPVRNDKAQFKRFV